MIMRFLILSSFLFLAACESTYVNTSQDLTVDLIGTDNAFCKLSTPFNRYEMHAPGTIKIERDDVDLKLDCDDNHSDKRRVVLLESEWTDLYFRYPENVTVDFSSGVNGRAPITKYKASLLDKPKTYEGQMIDQAIAPQNIILTEESFNEPVETDQTYPVVNPYAGGMRSYPVDINE